MSPCYFVLACARSGSTSLARILDLATNGKCAIEPSPNLNRETREVMEGRLNDPMQVVQELIVPRVKEQLAKVEIYGEKNVTYGPFIPYLYEALRCKFVFLRRDGRDVVRSLVDWHDRMFGSIYRECRDSGTLSPTAMTRAAELPVHKDTSDYARPRPLPEHSLYGEWPNLSREEMCAYYWSFINELYINALAKIPRDHWIELDYAAPDTIDIERVYNFLGLKEFDTARVREMLTSRINSLSDRIGEADTYPAWPNWDGGLRRRFDRIAGETMSRLGYYRNDGSDWRPPDYGQWWCEDRGDLEWYTWMYNSRRKMHSDMIKWVRDLESEGQAIQSIAEFGCGLGVGYRDDFSDRQYVGFDVSSRNIEWCNSNRTHPGHYYVCADVMLREACDQFDLVFSSGTIDNCYDIEVFLESMVRHSKKWIYVTCYRGWFPDLREHKYMWSQEHRCFYNDVSPRRVRECLENLGLDNIIIRSTRTENFQIPYETLIIARVP